MMTLEQRIQVMLGERDLLIASLQTQLEQAQAKIAELEGGKNKSKEPHLSVVQPES